MSNSSFNQTFVSLPVTVGNGGTGATSLTGVLKGNGAAAITGSATLTDVGAPTANFSMNSHKLTSVTDPTSAQDAATKAYVDSQITTTGFELIFAFMGA